MTNGSRPFATWPHQRTGFLSPGGSSHALSPFAFVNDAIVQAAREAIIIIDEDQRVVMINPAAQRMFGWPGSEALGVNLDRFIPQRFRRAHALHVRKFNQSGTAERPMGERSHVIGLRANGTEFPIEATISRLDVVDTMGARQFFTALIRDLSEVQDLRSEIEALNLRLRSIFEVAPIAIWIANDDQIVFANRACVSLFGASSREDLVGRSIYSLLAPGSQESVRTALSQVLGKGNNGAPVATNECIAGRDGRQREVEIAMVSLPDHGETTVQMVITDYTRRNMENRELQRSHQQFRQLSASLADTREEERRRIARELHDELGQRLTALQMELSSLSSVIPSPDTRQRIDSMLGMVDETIASVRRIATDLRPLMLDDLGLTSAIEWLAGSWSKRLGIRVKLDLGQDNPALNDSAAIALYRMVQEALTNVARHAKATEVKIQLRQQAGELTLMVRDNGVGFREKTADREGSLGLMGIRERANMLGGKLEIGNTRSGGGRIQIRVPIDRVGSEASLDCAPDSDIPALAPQVPDAPTP